MSPKDGGVAAAVRKGGALATFSHGRGMPRGRPLFGRFVSRPSFPPSFGARRLAAAGSYNPGMKVMRGGSAPRSGPWNRFTGDATGWATTGMASGGGRTNSGDRAANSRRRSRVGSRAEKAPNHKGTDHCPENSDDARRHGAQPGAGFGRRGRVGNVEERNGPMMNRASRWVFLPSLGVVGRYFLTK